MSAFGVELQRLRRNACMAQTDLARKVRQTQPTLSRWEQGHCTPPREIARELDDVLGGNGTLERAATPVPTESGAEPVTADYVQQIHNDIARLVDLDAQHGGADLVPMAARLFRQASVRLAGESCPDSLRSDFAVAVAELGEVAGWLAFDSQHYERARWLSTEALSVAHAAGDRDMELFLLGNLSLLARESGNPKEAESTARYMQSFSLSPRLEAMAWMRRARARADLGDYRAVGLMTRARGRLQDGVRDDDPQWAWWINDREMLIHEAGVHRNAGNLDRAVECYAQAWESYPQDYRWGRLMGAANLADVLVQARQFGEAGTMAATAKSLSWDVTSARAAQKLQNAARRARVAQAPEELSGVLAVAGQQAAC